MEDEVEQTGVIYKSRRRYKQIENKRNKKMWLSFIHWPIAAIMALIFIGIATTTSLPVSLISDIDILVISVRVSSDKMPARQMNYPAAEQRGIGALPNCKLTTFV